MNRAAHRPRRGGAPFPRAKKQLGQHFLSDANVVRRIVETIAPSPEDTIIEVGPGLGALTEHLVGRVRRVIGVELDSELHRRLVERFGEKPDAAFLRRDILAYDFAGVRDALVVGNIPYQITSPLLGHLLAHRQAWRAAWVTMQREVAERMTAAPDTPEYGRLSCAVQYWTQPRICFRIRPGSFSPPPRVESVLLHLSRRAQPAVTVRDEARFFSVINAAFAHRRKTLLNNLLSLPGWQGRRQALDMVIRAAGLDPRQRGETLSLEQFARLSHQLDTVGRRVDGRESAC